MLERLRASRLTLLVSSVVVLFVAFGGQAQAVKKAKKNSVVAKSIKAGAVKASKIADGAVTSTKIADGAVTGAKLDVASINGLDRCPSGAPNRSGDICFGEQQGPALWDAALDDCFSEDLRIPSIGEGFLVLRALPNNTDLWSDEVGDLSVGNSLRVFVRKQNDGTPEPFATSNANSSTYRCVATPTN